MPFITRKAIQILSHDVSDVKGDKLRLALGNSWTIEETADEYSPAGVRYTFTQPHKIGTVDYTSADPVRDLKAYRPETNPDYEPFGVHRLIESYEANVYNVTMINPNSYVPNFKIPIRFYADAANSKGDLYWNTYWLGGNYDDKDYFPLIDESRTYYTTNATISLPYWAAPIDKGGFVPLDASLYSFRTFSVKANYPSYDEHVQSRIDYESQLNERLLPNYNYTLDEIQAAYTEFDEGAYESGMEMGWEKLKHQKTELKKWYFQDSISVSRIASANRNIYFGTHWPMVWGEEYPAAARENADRHQENIMFDQYYYEYYTTSTGADIGDSRSQNLVDSSKMYDITVEFTPSKDLYDDPMPLRFDQGDRAIEAVGQNLIRDIIEENNFSSKFLEILKDIEEGSYPDFPQTNTSYSGIESYGSITADLRMQGGLVWYSGLGYRWETQEWAPHTTRLSDQQFKSFDWLDMLAYIYNKPTEGVNDNFIFLGPPEIRHHTTNANNTTYRYIETIGNLSVLDATMDHLGQLYQPMFEALRQNEYYTHDDLKMSSPNSIASKINTVFMKGTDRTSAQVLAYRIDKFEATPAGLPVGEPIQKFWFFNAKEVPSKISLVDSQVKFGKHYVYRCTAYVASIANKYKYTNLRLTKQIGKYEIDGHDTYCVQFYNPYTQLVADQTFASKLASPDVSGDVTYQTTGLSDYNLVATLAQDFINYPQAADLFLNIQPCIKILEVPLFEKACGVYDNPSNGMTVDPFHFMDASDRVGFSIKGDPYKPYFYPALIKESDKQMKDNYLNSKELFEDQYVDNYSRSAARYLEMYRISKKPTSFYDFGRNLVSRIDLRIPGETYNLKDYVAVDKIVPNKTYYYLFRFINENGMPSWPSPIIETQLVNDGGYIYSLFEHLDTAEFIQDPFENPSTSFKKLVHIEPNIQQLQFDTSAADFSLPANTQLNAVKLGVSDEKLWDKKFKVRLTSKKTGKKIDLNITYDVDDIDMSSMQDYYLDPDDTDGARSFIKSVSSG